MTCRTKLLAGQLAPSIRRTAEGVQEPAAASEERSATAEELRQQAKGVEHLLAFFKVA